MTVAYFDCFSGVAGDMILGALVDGGLPFDELKSEIEKIGLSGYSLSCQKVTRNSIAATKLTIDVNEKQPHRTPKEIARIISDSRLDDDVKTRSIRIFRRLAEAEARVHGEEIEKVHLHELGALDAIIDICGAVWGLTMLGIDRVYSSPLALGRGTVNTQHGLMPVPAPATAELVKDIPVRLTDVEAELTTPTGAAIMTTLAEFTLPLGEGIFEPKAVGYGAGSRTLQDLPNLLRVTVGETVSRYQSDSVAVLETNLDRVSPENLAGLVDDLMEAGALDVYVSPVLMKKGRPGHLVSVLCQPDKKDKLAALMFRSGKTLGVRVGSVERIKLARREVKVTTSGGEVRVKLAEHEGNQLIFPEYDDMVRAMKNARRSYDDIFFEIQETLRKG